MYQKEVNQKNHVIFEMEKMILFMFLIIWILKLVITVDKVEEISSRKYKILFVFSIGEKWGTAFGEDGGRIISAKVQVSRFV